MRKAQGSILRLAVIGLAAAAAPVAAQAPEPRLTLVDAVERALATHPAVAGSSAGAAEGAAALGEARAARWPALEMSGSARRYQEPMVVTPIHGFTPEVQPAFDETLFHGELRLGYTLLDAARGARIDGAALDLDAARVGVAEARQAVTARVGVTYLDVLGAAEVAAAHVARVAALRSELARVQRFIEQGRAPAVEAARVEAALAGAEAELVSAQATLRTAEHTLARLIGVDPTATRRSRLAPVTLHAAAPPSRDRLLAEAMAASPALERARLRAAAAEAAGDAAAKARWPRVELTAGYGGWGAAEGHFTGEWSAGVQLAVPLFTGGAISSRIERADAAAAVALSRAREAELELLAEVDAALAALEEAVARSRALERAVARHEDVVRTERVSLEVGTGVQTDYLRAESDLLAGRAQRTQARYAEISLHIRLAQLSGRLTPAWLAAALEVQP